MSITIKTIDKDVILSFIKKYQNDKIIMGAGAKRILGIIFNPSISYKEDILLVKDGITYNLKDIHYYEIEKAKVFYEPLLDKESVNTNKIEGILETSYILQTLDKEEHILDTLKIIK